MRKSAVIATLAAGLAIVGGSLIYAAGELRSPGPVAEAAPQAVTAEVTPPVMAPGLAGMLPSYSDIVQAVTPAVVNIAVKSTVEPDPRLKPYLQDPSFRRRYNIPDQMPKQERESGGSGVIIDAAKGYVVTNFHVIDNATDIKVTLQDGRSATGKVVGKDKDTDIAVVQIEADNLTAMRVGDSGALRVGDFVLAVGSPFGLDQTVTSGIVSGMGRSGLSIEGYEDFIQTDAAINPGNSGGALVNLKGELVGINTAILSGSGGNVGVGFAVPTSMASAVVDQLIKSGKVTRGRIGAEITDLSPALAQSLGLKQTHGALINRVVKNGPGDKAGLEAGDLVVAIDQAPVANASTLRNRIGFITPGEIVTLGIVRDGKSQDVKVSIGQVPENVSTAAADTDDDTPAGEVPRLEGAAFENAAKAHDGIRVVDVTRDSPAWQVGLRPGDVIAAVNRNPVEDVDQLQSVLGESSRQAALFIRRGDEQFLIVLRG